MKTRDDEDWQTVKKGAHWSREGVVWKRRATKEEVRSMKNAFEEIAEEEI